MNDKNKEGYWDHIYHPPGCQHPRPDDETKDGPSKVSSDAYRTGWETVFGKRQPAGQA